MTTTSGETVNRVLAFLGERFPEQRDGLEAGTDLRSSILLDSLALMEVLMFIEQEFGLSLERADLDAFQSPRSIADLIDRKRTA